MATNVSTVPKNDSKITFEAPKVHRMVIQDLFWLKDWLYPKMKERWPSATETTFNGWMQNYMINSAFCAFSSKNAVAVATMGNDTRDKFLFAELLWSAHNANFLDEAMMCVVETLRWAKRMKCLEYRISDESDIPMTKMISEMKKHGFNITRRRQYYYLERGTRRHEDEF